MIGPCKKRENKGKQVFEMRLEGKFGLGKLYIIWEDIIKRMGKKVGMEMVEIKMIGDGRFDWQKWVEKGYPNAGKSTRFKEVEEKEEEDEDKL